MKAQLSALGWYSVSRWSCQILQLLWTLESWEASKFQLEFLAGIKRKMLYKEAGKAWAGTTHQIYRNSETLKPGILVNSTLTFITCLHRVSMSASGLGFQAFQVFLRHVPYSTFAHALLHFHKNVASFQRLDISIFRYPFEVFVFGQPLVCLNWYCCLRQLWWEIISIDCFP